MAGPHDAIIADAAKVSLGPLGFRRKGRSRLWWADRGYWLNVVEFQPSAWSKGSYLNVAAHFLWSPPDDKGAYVISFDHGGRCAEHVKFLDEEQFQSAAADLGQLAAAEGRQLDDQLLSLNATADVLVAAESEARQRRRGRHWGAYHAGMASALTGQPQVAAELFRSVLETPAPTSSVLHAACAKWLGLIDVPECFREQVALQVNRQRGYFQLTQLDADPF